MIELEFFFFSVGTVFLLTGSWMRFFPPKKINGLYGYRTTRSMRTQEAWDFAQRMSANWMLGLSGIFGVLSLLFWLIGALPEWIMGFGLATMVVMLIVMFWRIERALKRNFS
jgi:uncharacterized membrane protein